MREGRVEVRIGLAFVLALLAPAAALPGIGLAAITTGYASDVASRSRQVSTTT